VYDMMRCKTRAYCKVMKFFGDMNKIRLTLLMRLGERAFKNETSVKQGMQEGGWMSVEDRTVE